MHPVAIRFVLSCQDAWRRKDRGRRQCGRLVVIDEKKGGKLVVATLWLRPRPLGTEPIALGAYCWLGRHRGATAYSFLARNLRNPHGEVTVRSKS